jgi:hypothetical protein
LAPIFGEAMLPLSPVSERFIGEGPSVLVLRLQRFWPGALLQSFVVALQLGSQGHQKQIRLQKCRFYHVLLRCMVITKQTLKFRWPCMSFLIMKSNARTLSKWRASSWSPFASNGGPLVARGPFIDWQHAVDPSRGLPEESVSLVLQPLGVEDSAGRCSEVTFSSQGHQ